MQTFAGDVVPVHVGGDVVSRLEALGRACGVVGCTLFQLVLAVWCMVLCRHAGQEEVVVGSPYHGRDAPGSEGLIGYFVNMLALRVEAGVVARAWATWCAELRLLHRVGCVMRGRRST